MAAKLVCEPAIFYKYTLEA